MNANNSNNSNKIPTHDYYSEYHGHDVLYLQHILSRMRESTDRIIWTAGDSSLDNKYWFRETSRAVDDTVYAELLDPPIMKQDVTYWLQYLSKQQYQQEHQQQHQQSPSGISPARTGVMNTAVEATTLNERTYKLRAQDRLIRDNLRPQDILIVSVGGNDVALLPMPCTIAAIGGMVCCLPTQCIDRGFSCGVVPCDDPLCGCTSSCASCACAFPPCLGYMRHLFGVRVQKYVEALTSKTKPSLVLVCMIYYPDETNAPGWAGPALRALGYNTNPSQLQALIRKGYNEATCRIRVEGTTVIPVPFFHVLDGKDTNDYIQRVEPSPVGGRKMAEYLLHIIRRHEESHQEGKGGAVIIGGQSDMGPSTFLSTSSPTSSYIRGRG